MSIFSGIAKIIAGAAAIAGGIILEPVSVGFSNFLISAGAGLALSGVGTIISGSGTGRNGTAASERNPIKPWDVVYGQARVGGTCVYMNQWPPPGGYGGPTGIFSIFGIGPQSQRDANNFLDLVYVVAAHPIQSVDAVLFDGTPIAIDPTALFPISGGNTFNPALGGTSYNPTQTNKQSTSISRVNGVITVVCPFDIPALAAGYPIILQDENGHVGLTDTELAGTYVVEQILSRSPGASLTFTVLGGGPNVTVPNSTYTSAGWVTTKWPSYGRDVYVEYLLGDQILGQTFNGMQGTPFQGNLGTGGVNPNINTHNTGPGGAQPWTTSCSLQGKSAVFMRLYFESQYFSGGLPQISFYIHGKNNIYDPRLGAATGVRQVALYSAGSGGYSQGDVLALVQSGGSNGKVTLTGVDTSGNPTAWTIVPSGTGSGYSLGVCTTTGGHGSGAEFTVTTLGAISSGVAGVSIAAVGQSYNKGDVLSVQYPGGTLGLLKVTGTGGGGGVTTVAIIEAGYWYNSTATQPSLAANVPTAIVSSLHSNLLYGTNNYAAGGGTGCEVNITSITGAASTGGYTTNAALCIADYLADTIWGYNATYVLESSVIAPYNNIGATALTTAANVCDQPIELAASVETSPPTYQTEPLYTCNGRFDLSMTRGDVLQNLLTSCAGRFLYVGGIYSVQPGYWVPTGFPSGTPPVPAGTTTSVNLQSISAGKPTWRPNIKVRELFNVVKGTYINPSNKWEPSDFPYYAQDSLHGYSGPAQYGGDINLAVDLGQRRFKDIHLPFTISASMAQRIAKIELLRGRNQGGYGIGTGTFPCNLAAYQFVPLDILSATFPFLWTNELLEVTAVRFRAEKDKEGNVALSTELDVQQTSADIYAWSVYEELTPEGYQEAFSPKSTVSESVPFAWAPGAVAPLNGDAVYTAGTNGPGTFGVSVSYGADSQGNSTANLVITGALPINNLDTFLSGPFVSANANDGGGSIPPGTYTVGVSAFDGGTPAKNIAYLDLATVSIGGGGGAATISIGSAGFGYYANQVVTLQGGNNNCQVTITGVNYGGIPTGVSVLNAGSGYTTIDYPVIGGAGQGLTVYVNTLTAATSTGSVTLFPAWGVGNDGGDVSMAAQTTNTTQYQQLASLGQTLAENDLHYQTTLSPGQTSVTLTAFNASTAGGPDTIFDHFNIVWQPVIHTGPWAEQVQLVTGTSGSSPGIVQVYGNGMTSNQWAGYVLTLLAYYDPAIPIPILNMPIVSSTASSGGVFGMTIGQNALGRQLPSLTSLLNRGDLVGVRYNATFTSSSFTDPNIANGYYTSGDLDTEAGHVAVVLTGADAGDIQTVSGLSNSLGPITPSNPATPTYPATTVNLQGTWQTTPATGDIVIICAATTQSQATKSFQTPNKTGGVVTVATPSVENLLGGVWLFTVETCDNLGNAAPVFVAPRRDIYLFGAGGSVTLTSSATMSYWIANYDCNCSSGNITVTAIPMSSVPEQEFTVTKTDSTANAVTWNLYSGDTFSDGSTSWTTTTQGGSRTIRASA